MAKLKKPYDLLLWSIIPVIAAFFLQVNTTFDIQLHDTYFVINPLIIYATIVIFLILLWAVYRITETARLIKKLVWVHIILTIAPLLLLAIYQYSGELVPNYSRYPVSFESFTQSSKALTIATGLVSLFLAGQLVFLANLTFAIIRLFKAR